uniref:Uncharacterized protein n=1 Tax=Rhizophora mucronata TaxID=61149 RepID=A0A2P2NQN2_RHIMU
MNFGSQNSNSLKIVSLS